MFFLSSLFISAGYQTLQPALQNAPKDTILKRKFKKKNSGEGIQSPDQSGEGTSPPRSPHPTT